MGLNKHYVYAWFNKETDNVFYIGKGSGRRAKRLNRRKIDFRREYNKYDCDYKILEDNLDEDVAYEREIYYIEKYKEINQAQCNISPGGKFFPVLRGENNPMYGVSPKERMTPEIYEQWLKNRSVSVTGDKNSQFGVSPKERMSEEKYNQWVENHRNITYENNPKAKPVDMIKDNIIIETFLTVKHCAEFLIEKKIVRAKKVKSVQNRLSTMINNKVLYRGFLFSFANKENKNKINQ